MSKRITAELLGTFWLTFGGCGTALYAASVPSLGVGYLGVALAFGLTVVTMAYAVGHVSGAHFNPAVTLGLWVGHRLPGRDVLPYIGAQLLGGILAAGALYAIAQGQHGFEVGRFASNGYGQLSPGNFDLLACLAAEVIATFFFVLIIMGSTAPAAPTGFAPLAIGLALTLIHLVLIPITNTSVNPARSTGVALVAGGQYIEQLWLFWVAPLAGGMVGGIVGRCLSGRWTPRTSGA